MTLVMGNSISIVTEDAILHPKDRSTLWTGFSMKLSCCDRQLQNRESVSPTTLSPFAIASLFRVGAFSDRNYYGNRPHTTV